MSRENAKLAIIAAFCLVVGLSAPAVSATVERALYADRAGKVDGRDAVGAGATVAQRSGKLVATSPTTGRLPDNIIAKAPDAAKLGGFTAAQLKTVSVPLGGLIPGGGAAVSAADVALADTTSSTVSAGFYVPANHRQPDPVRADLVVYTVGACNARLTRFGAIVTPGTTAFNGTAWLASGGTDSETQALPPGYSTLTYLLDESAAVTPGSIVHLGFTLLGGDPADTCTVVSVMGMQFRY
jgi:hypothetical protein